jgi:peptidylprolyl isomerase
MVSLNNQASSPAPGDELRVASPLNTASNGAGGGSLLGASANGGSNSGGGTTGSGTATPAPGAEKQAPTPDQFGQYDQYATQQDALFGDIVEGTGPAVEVGSSVAVNYRGWLTNGTPFDDSYKTGKPFVFQEGQHRVVLGWEEGVLGMKVGGKRRVIVPPAAGYGSDAHGPVPANAVMVFDIELVAVQ